MECYMYQHWFGVCLHLCIVNLAFGSENLALNKPAYQLSGFAPASKAVDGNPSTDWNIGSCQHTADDPKITITWWRDDLTAEQRIKTIKIYNRKGFEKRLRGYRLYVSNTSSSANSGFLCFFDENHAAATTNTQQCNVLGRYVVIYMDKDNGAQNALLNLCEVQVFGCEQNKFGSDNCASTCHCAVGGCDPDTGVCDNPQYGCDVGWAGKSCNEVDACAVSSDDCKNGATCVNTIGGYACSCVPGFQWNFCETACTSPMFGEDCSSKCHCKDGPCNNIDGVCQTPGCIAGYKGDSCDTACNSNTFGENCVNICHCKFGDCPGDTGICNIIGCLSGFRGDNCSLECDAHTYGEGCVNTCNCFIGDCNKTSGICDVPGCKGGWKGNSCSQVCTGRTFGYNCNTTCNCKTGGCDASTGVCETKGCVAGWAGDSCDQACGTTRFGENCNSTCYCLTGGCDNANGTCVESGCQKGWNGTTCTTACMSPWFGENCENKCHCLSGFCDVTRGVCMPLGCVFGKMGDSCSKDCDADTFGPDCTQTCHCAQTGCNNVNGTCDVTGCRVGYKGATCSIVAAKRVEPNDDGPGGIIGGASAGAAVVIVVVIIGVVMCRRRKLSKQNKVPEQPTRPTLEYEKDRDYINMGITVTSSDNKSNHQTDPYSSLDTVGMPENVYDVIKN